MDATRRYEPAAVESVPEQEDTPANIEPVPVEENISQPTTDDEFLTVERSGLAAGTLDPYATVMTDPAAPAPGAAPQTPHAVAAPPVRKVTVPADAPAAPAGRSVAPAKKSSKKGLLVGGLAALFLLIAAGGAGGWFVYQKYYAAAASRRRRPARLPRLHPHLPWKCRSGRICWIIRTRQPFRT